MSPPLLVVTKEEGLSNASTLASASSPQSLDCFSQNGGASLKERNYLGLSDCSSVDSSAAPGMSDDKKDNLNLKATELRLGLPGSQSPERGPDIFSLTSTKLDEKPLFPLLPTKDGICSSTQKTIVSGNKRGFADAMDGFPEAKFPGTAAINVMLSPRPAGVQPTAKKEMPSKVLQGQPGAVNGTGGTVGASSPASKAQVVGWPPIRSFRKNSLATTSKNNDEVDGKPSLAALFVKVSMDGAPYLRKVDLQNYTTYQELSSALEKMFSCFILGQCGSHGASGREMMSESKLKDLLHGSEYVLTYEDKDGDWMLVGDVPWEMFIDTCKRLKIMKGSDAIGLAPRAVEKSRSRS
ncbi:Auxin-responsive protein iaa9 [Stylosanthes scabra]|uniref:Auxin-induced protein n=1 Tax=Stylosanthes scabra TaxID=79078 RepID=A0ABU6R527_9FABA|nr:Auxin-responsive protein iaa9 [Stylosanthes scabra]